MVRVESDRGGSSRRLHVGLIVLGLTLVVPGARGQSAETTRLAAELLREMRFEEGMRAGVTAGLDAQVRGNPLLAPFRAVMHDWASRYLTWDTVGPATVKLYADRFTAGELREMLAFYRTPIGRKMLEAQQPIMAEAARIAEAALAPHQAELQSAIKQRADELQRGATAP
ncbi:MAG: hypothetical protein NVS4B3_16780 [Gemmatimonadaceae bacterium]